LPNNNESAIVPFSKKNRQTNKGLRLSPPTQFSHVDTVHAVTHAYIYGHTLLAQAAKRQEPFLRKDRACHVPIGTDRGICAFQYVVCVRAGIVRSFMCHAAVANSGEQEHQLRRRPLAADIEDDRGGGRGQPQPLLPGEPSVMETTAAPWQSSRQAREMSAMVAALTTVVAGSAPPPDKGPAGTAQPQDASMDEAWWPYEDLQVGEPSSPARFVLQGKSVTEQAGQHMRFSFLFLLFSCMHYSVFSTYYFIFFLGYLDVVVGRTRVDDLSCIE